MIRTCVAYLLLLFVGLFIQSSLIHASYPAAIAPDILVILVIILALRSQTLPVLIAAFVLGVLGDFASGQFVGPNAAGAITAFALAGVVAKKLYVDRSLAIAVIAFLCSLAKSFVSLLLVGIYATTVSFGDDILSWAVVRVVVIEACLNAVCAPLLLKVLSWGKGISVYDSASGEQAHSWSQVRKNL